MHNELAAVDIVMAAILFPVIVASLAMMLPFYLAATLYRKYRSKYDY